MNRKITLEVDVEQQFSTYIDKEIDPFFKELAMQVALKAPEAFCAKFTHVHPDHQFDTFTWAIATGMHFHTALQNVDRALRIFEAFTHNNPALRNAVLYQSLSFQDTEKHIEGIVHMINHTDVILDPRPTRFDYQPLRDKKACLRILQAFYKRHLKQVPDDVSVSKQRTYSTAIRQSIEKFLQAQPRGTYFVDCAFDMFGIEMKRISLTELQQTHTTNLGHLKRGFYDHLDPSSVSNLKPFDANPLKNMAYHALISGYYDWFDALRKQFGQSEAFIHLSKPKAEDTVSGELLCFDFTKDVIQPALDALKDTNSERYDEIRSRY